MTQIKILPDNLVNQIAAGEVVERPSSVVKELIENSIDASASTITVEVEAGGKKLIKVTDNGKGITEGNLPLVFERHATSKIATEEDLTKISTMGFRGEAVASISSVARMSVASRPEVMQEHGNILTCEGGEFTDIEPYAMPQGTQVIVRNLFFNTPARQKFMKTDQTEFNYITKYITEVALIHPEIHFKLIHNGRLVAEYVPAGNPYERASQVFGNTIAKELLQVQYMSSDFKIQGFIGKPGIARANRKSQYIFVNNRPVSSSAVSAAVQKAYYSLLPQGKYPFFILNIHLPFEKIDVNVHPRKLEVRFLYQNELFTIVTTTIKKTLESEVLSPALTGDSRSYWNTEKLYSNKPAQFSDSSQLNTPTQRRFENTQMGRSMYSDVKPTQNSVNQALNFTKNMLDSEPREHKPLESKPEESLTLQPVCQIAHSYILAHGEDGIVVIDQHAAHERILYNKFLKQAKEQQAKEPETQKLLVPAELELSISEVQLLEVNVDILRSIGFEIESFGGNTFHIHSVPSALIKVDIQKIILEVIDDLKNNDPKKLKEPQHATICYMACRGAIKFGDPLTHQEMVELVRQMDRQVQKYTCPHGRPTMLNLTFAELEKRFGRK